MTRVAAVDCGTNSIRLLVTDIVDGRKTDIVREMRIVRLGHGVDRTGRLDDTALHRTFAACDDYAAMIEDLGAQRIRFCATSATRDASNAAVFGDGVRARFDVAPDVLSGDEEAALSFVGASRDLGDVAEPVLVVDLGGGSTELVLGHGTDVDAAQSLDIGSVRMTERHLHGDPPGDDEIAACVADIDAALDGSAVDLAAARSAVGVAGSVTTIAAHALGLPAYDPATIHHAHIPFADMESSCRAITSATVGQRRAMPFMHPGRADVIGAGALIVTRILARLTSAEPELIVSESDILDGIAWSLA